MKETVRDSKFELLRIISMVLIIFYHITYHSITVKPVIHTNFLYSLLYSGGKYGVVLFMMITGYFLINKTTTNYKRLIKLEFQVLFYSILTYFGITLIAGYPFNKNEMMNIFLPNIMKTYWFYSGYFLVILLSPYITKTIKNLEKKEYLKLLIILFIFLIVLPSIKFEYMNEVVMLLFYFLVGGFIKKYGSDYQTFSKLFLVIAISCYVLIGVSIMMLSISSLNNYNVPIDYLFYSNLSSPLVFFSVSSFFLWFSYQKIKYSKIINKLGSISFAVYLIHDHFIARRYLWNDLLEVDNPNNILKTIIIFIISIIFVYLVAYILESIRNYLFNIIIKQVKKIKEV